MVRVSIVFISIVFGKQRLSKDYSTPEIQTFGLISAKHQPYKTLPFETNLTLYALRLAVIA
jgi:hypothetical protein